MSYNFDPTLEVLFITVCYFNDIIHMTFLSAIIWYDSGVFSPNTRRDMPFKAKIPSMTSGNPTKRERNTICREETATFLCAFRAHSVLKFFYLS